MSKPVATEPMTAEAFMALPDDGRVLELWEGVVVEMPPPGQDHGWLEVQLSSVLAGWCRARRRGQVMAGDVAVVVEQGPDTVLGADVAGFADRPLGRPASSGAARELPQVVVEIASPSDRPRAIRDKADRWLAAGVAEVWLVWPDEDAIDVMPAEGEPVRFGANDTLTTDLLPDFKLPLNELFGA